MSARFLPALAILACALLPTGAQAAQPDEFSSPSLSALPREGWRTNGGNLSNQRYSPLEGINRDNVTGLKGSLAHPSEWVRGWCPAFSGAGSTHGLRRHDLHQSPAPTTCLPLDADSGAIIWQYPPTGSAALSTCVLRLGESRCRPWAMARCSSGQARWSPDRTGHAHRQGTWSVQAEDPRKRLLLATAPLYLRWHDHYRLCRR